MNKRLIAIGLLTAILSAGLMSCGTEEAPPAETTAKPVMTIIRTKTPYAPLTDEEIEQLGRGNDHWGGPNNNDNNNNQQQERPDVQEKGDGMALDGYRQLLDDIDRGSFRAPGGWDRHPVDDLFDGVFETTDQGTNKYGTNDTTLTVEWAMNGACIIDAYTVVTASDGESFPERTPQNWRLEGSNDRNNWAEIDKVESAGLPAANYTPVTFKIENETAYRYYRWVIEETAGNNMFQVSELLLYTLDGPRGMTLVDYGQSENEAKVGEPLTGPDAKSYIDQHEALQSKVKKDGFYTDVETYGDGPIENLFDGVYTQQSFDQHGGGKMGAGGDKARFVWQTEEAVTLSAYALVTGNDNRDFQDRLPIAWSLYGSNDGDEWTLIDAISDGKMESLNFEPYVYELDSADAYSYFTLVVEETNGAVQLCEFLMLK